MLILFNFLSLKKVPIQVHVPSSTKTGLRFYFGNIPCHVTLVFHCAARGAKNPRMSELKGTSAEFPVALDLLSASFLRVLPWHLC